MDVKVSDRTNVLTAPPGKSENNSTETAFWPAFWLAVVLVGAKADYLAHQAADPPSGKLAFVVALSAISYADILYALALGALHRLALFVRRPPFRAMLRIGFLALYLL